MLKKVMLLIAAGYALILVLVLALGLAAIAGIERVHTINQELYAHTFTVNGAALELRSAVSLMRADMLDIASPNSPEEVRRLSAETVALEAAARANLGIVKANFLGDMARIKEIASLLDAWQTLRAREFALTMQGRMRDTDRLVKGEGARVYLQLADDVDHVVDSSRRRAEIFVAQSEQESAGNIRMTWWMLAGLIAIISISGGVVANRIASLIRIGEQMDESLRKYATQLEASNKELESFSYSVSHDLRVPLRAVDGFSRLLLEEYHDKLDAEGRRLLNVVRDNTKRMAQLIDDILAFSRTGRLELSDSDVNMEDMVRDVMTELAPNFAGRDLRLEVGALPHIFADRAMMRRVWVNLLSNAIKFSRPKPAAQIEVGASHGEQEVVYYVRDNGVGFDMKYVGKLFGMFLRLHGVDEFEGTGIGLAIVKRIVSRHGGRVWAEGKPGEGATIYFALPTKEPT